MSRPLRFWLTWFFSTLTLFTALAALFGIYYSFERAEVRYLQEQQAELRGDEVLVTTITDPEELQREINHRARLQFAYVAGSIAFYMLLILTVYVFMAQFYPAEQELYPPIRRYSLLRIGAWMLVGGGILLIIAYLNLWAAPDYLTYQGCRVLDTDTCELNGVTIAVLVQQWISYIAMALSLPVLLIGLIVEDLEGWEF